MAELEAMRANKAEKRGGFKEKIFLEYVEGEKVDGRMYIFK